jgi:signal transduction histidine kinase
MRRYLFLLALLSSITYTSFSQIYPGFRIQKFNTESGLPSNGIKGLQWDDSTGFLWIATEAGIVRYNGLQFKIFNKEDEPHIANERILFMIKNNSGKIYAADNRGNLFYVENNNLKFLLNKRLGSDFGNNFISAAVSENLLNAKIDFKKQVFSTQYNPIFPSGDTAAYIIKSPDIFYFSNTVTSPIKVNLEKEIDKGFKTNDKIFLYDAAKNISLFNEVSHQMVNIPLESEPNLSIDDIKKGTMIWESGMQNPILFSKQRAWLLSYKNGSISASLICDVIPGDILIRYAQFDQKRKRLFIGTDSKGIIVIEPNLVQSVKAKGLPPGEHTSYYSQVELPDGNILTNEGHALGLHATAATNPPIKGRFGTNTLMVGDSIFWYAQVEPNSSANIFNLHSYNFRTHKTKNYPPIRETYQLLMASSGSDIYFSLDSGIYKLNADTLEKLFSYTENSKSGMDFDMQQIEPGVFAIANCNSILRFNVREKKLDTIFGPGSYCFRSIWKYNNYIFLGSYGGGLFIYKDGKTKALPLDKNKYLLFTHCFVQDDSGYCWISTNRGLFKARITELVEAFHNDEQQVYYYYYGKNDGMDMTELNGGCVPCALVKKDKTISFPTMDGLLWVNPKQSAPPLSHPQIYFDNISVDNKLFDPDSLQQSKLSSSTEEIIVRLAFSAWENKENLYVDYKLNADAKWRPMDIEGGTEIRFSNLPPGDYKLSIRKRNGFGSNNYSYQQLQFHINVPWYEKWWFYLFAIALTGALIWLYSHLRTRQLRMNQLRLEKQVAEKTRQLQEKTDVLEKSDRIKTRLISIISHDLVTPLKFLTAVGKNLLDKKHLMTEELQSETLGEIINTSQELHQLSTNILNWIKYQNENRRLSKENFSVHELTNQVVSILNSLAKQKHLLLKNETDPHLTVYQFHEPLKILIYNLVLNAINFTDRGTITIGTRENAGATFLFVKDEGVGMTPEQIENIMGDQFIVSSANVDNRKGNGLGYLIIKDLLKMTRGYFTIQSEKGRGTVVSILLKSEDA